MKLPRAIPPAIDPHGLPLGRRPRGIVGLRFQPGDHGISLSSHEWLDSCVPTPCGGRGFPQQDVGSVPQKLNRMDDIQHQGM
jgi:hypothetical protein